ncbi:MAG: PEP-CTERM sorting domain-containing protein [Tepidisphaeraceae bacterium]
MISRQIRGREFPLNSINSKLFYESRCFFLPKRLNLGLFFRLMARPNFNSGRPVLAGLLILVSVSFSEAATVTGNIQVTTVGTPSVPAMVLGYLASAPNGTGEFVLADLSSSISNRLLVSFDPTAATIGGSLPGSLSVTVSNGPVGASEFNTLGGIVGPESSSNNLINPDPGVSYAILGGTPNLGGPSVAVQRQTYGSSSVQPVQSNIWSVTGSALQPVWLNSTGQMSGSTVPAPPVSIVFVDDRDGDPSNGDAEAFVLTADPDNVINNAFGGQAVTFSVVEAAPEPGSALLTLLAATSTLTRRRHRVAT